LKRKDAFRKLRVICQRLDEIDPEQFFVTPLRLYLFGSMLTDKPNLSDVDLLFKYRENPIDPDELAYQLSYGKPLPYEQAFKHLRSGNENDPLCLAHQKCLSKVSRSGWRVISSRKTCL
jgi:hypothetical protein